MHILIAVDLQNDFIDGVLGTPQARSMLPDALKKISQFKGNVYFTRDTHEENYLQTQEGKFLPIPHCIKNTNGWQLHPMVESLRVLPAIDKPAFGSTQLVSILTEINHTNIIESITLIGLCTDICVISNALLLKSFFPQIPICVDADCCAGVTVQSHLNALKAMKMCQIEIENIPDNL